MCRKKKIYKEECKFFSLFLKFLITSNYIKHYKKIKYLVQLFNYVKKTNFNGNASAKINL